MSITENRQRWKRLALSSLAGVLLGLSQPFYIHEAINVTEAHNYLGLLALVGYVPLFLAIAEQSLKTCFWLSTLTITIQHTITLYWIYIALHVHGHIPPVPSSLITVVLPLVLALHCVPFITLARYLSQRFSWSFFWLAPLALCAAEYFRNYYIFGGFPWGNVGYSIGRVPQFLQIASLVGVYGLVFLVALVNSLLCLAQKKRLFAGIAFGLIVSGYLFGVIRLHGSESEFAPSIRVGLLQGNISQAVKSEARLHSKEILQIYLELARKAKAAGAELIVWPESSHPRMLNKDLSEMDFGFDDRIASVIGAVVYGDNSDGSYYVHNSGFVVDFRGQVIKRYDKSHLVPFGEYVPWPMSGIVDKVVPGMGAFRPGIEFTPVNLAIGAQKTVTLGTTICYEGIFPEITRAYAKAGASLLVNLTNDAWYGFSSAAFQHLLMYRMRSAETGLPFVRATNTGISAWIDAYGQQHQITDLFVRDVVIADVPLLSKATFYTAVGDVLPILSLLFLLCGYIVAVLPVHHFVQQRRWHKLVIMAVLLIIPISSTVYFQAPQFLTDESARTKNLFIILLALLLMIGLLNKTKGSRSVLLVAGGVIVFVSVALAIFESLYFLFGLLFGLLIYLLAFRIRDDDRPIK